MSNYELHGRDVMGMYKRLLSYASENAKIGELRRKKNWRIKNKEKCNAMVNDWSRRNPEKRSDAQARWLQKHLDVHAAKQAKRRARIRANTIGDHEEVKKIYTRAKELRDEGIDVVVDHIHPVCLGGAHSAYNLQIIYRHENAVKRASVDYKPEYVFC